MSARYMALSREPNIVRISTGYLVDMDGSTLTVNASARPVVLRHSIVQLLASELAGNDEVVADMCASVMYQSSHEGFPMPRRMPPSSVTETDFWATEYRWVWWTVEWEER